MNYKLEIRDSFGNVHERKNQYILDSIKSGDGHVDKKSHPYTKKLNEFKRSEKTFLNSLKSVDAHIKDGDSNIIKELKKRLYKASLKKDFYSKYLDLTYSAVLRYEIAEAELDQIPAIINHYDELNEKLIESEERLKNLDPNELKKVEQEIEEKRKEQIKKFHQKTDEINRKYKEGLISKKAQKTEGKIAIREHKEKLNEIELLNESKSLKETIENLKHRKKIDIKSMDNVLESYISNIRRKTPVETEQKKPFLSYVTAVLPGLGQLLNGQKMKAFLFFLGSLFIYLIAIPYALGFGNYQGDGIAGLITLAEGGRRLDRSIMFMIEGIIAIILMVLAIGIFVMSFKDVYKVEKDKIKGIRPRNWFETKEIIGTDGFPYLVSSPGYILTIFIVLIPIITAILISFTNLDPNHQSKFTWIGIENYKILFLGRGVAGKAFWLILFWTLVWTLGATTLAIALGFILALLANQERIKGKPIFRTIYLLPWAVPAFITIMFFSLMVGRQGPITELFKNVFNITLDVKSNPTLTRISLILLQGWLGSSYIFLLSTGVLQGIPKDLYESADIDGATGLQKTWRITIPLVLFQTAPLLISQYTFNFNNFSIIYLFNGGGPFNPSKYGNLAGSSDILISYIYKLTMESNYQALGAAISILISLVLMFFAYIGFKNTKAFKES
ncbi:carbohydrate ABC transporter permease [Mediannikoviicoccus vaginalis]|uniref:carbohydrate ABC transporter permease n=1 Tax=Mediannikoviicoccus vaginalis TaxID=2899727 RepID=UPI001EFFC36A|nr:sugar ABC transporter permease [Mediannikoviicoccus vaginalis]